MYQVLTLVFGSYLFVALLVALYLQKELRRQLPLIEKLGEMGSVAIGMVTAAILWPIWLVKLFIIGFKYVTKGE